MKTKKVTKFHAAQPKHTTGHKSTATPAAMSAVVKKGHAKIKAKTKANSSGV